jgi:hypothetical protein
MARDADAAVAGAAVVALGKMTGESSGETVAALGKEARPATAWAVTEASLRRAEQLAAAGERESASAIYAELLRPSQPIHIQRGALAALLRLDQDGGEQRILLLKALANAKSPEERQAIELAVKKVTEAIKTQQSATGEAGNKK